MQRHEAVKQWFGGILYRSKLEACWASFWANLNISADYELEVFRTPDGLYLPDFYLHNLGLWQEVKPTRPEVGSHPWECCRHVAEISARPVALTWGQPSVHTNIADDLCALFSPAKDGAVVVTGFSVAGVLATLEADISGNQIFQAVIAAHRTLRWEPYDLSQEIKKWNPLWEKTLGKDR